MNWFKVSRSPIGTDNDVDNEANVGLMSEHTEKPLPPPPPPPLDNADRQHHLSRTSLIFTLLLSNIIWAVLFVFLLWHGNSHSQCPNNIFTTDFNSTPSLPHKVKTIQFDDLLSYNTSSQKVYRAMDTSLPQYFGPPSPSIDENWASLLKYQYPTVNSKDISSNPALHFSPTDRHPVTGKYHAALDVFHNLHCLNMIRKRLDKEHYGAHENAGHVGRSSSSTTNIDNMQNHNNNDNENEEDMPKSSFDAAIRDHIDHCMNHIRQSLQCRPDLSPAAMHVYEDTDGSQFFLGNAKSHSCYDWDGIMEWAEARDTPELGYTQPVA